jgi:N-acetylmuramoyl-L-alanine amidase
VLVDLTNTTLAAALKGGRYSYPDEVVRQVRVTGPDAGTLRVQVDLTTISRFSIYPMYEPYRLVIDIERRPSAPTPVAGGRTTADGKARASAPAPAPALAPPIRTTAPPAATARAETATPTTAAPTTAAAAAAPPSTAAGRGGYSLSRQLGLGAARIVIDPGHGGHDPGAQAGGLDEAELVLDVALRLERLLLDTPGVEVVMTRRTSQYVPLAERTAIANRAGADLFLSIHANSSPNPTARGIETYFLNLATDPDAQAVAARENATSGLTMRHLNDLVRTITFDDKRDESRDFAMRVQTSLYARLRKINRQARSLGVKQAPFQVLVGATMPSVLAEISFLTNEHESALLKTDSYRDQIAAALHEGVMGYQRSLKGATVRTSGKTGG